MTLRVKLYPRGGIAAHVADNTAVVGAVALVDAVNLVAEDTKAVFHLDAGCGAVVDFNSIQSRGIAAVNERTVLSLCVDGDDPVEAVGEGDTGIPEGVSIAINNGNS